MDIQAHGVEPSQNKWSDDWIIFEQFYGHIIEY
jgi:hypothetical protein